MKIHLQKQPFRRGLSQGQFIALGFLILILTGTMLLMLPVSSRDGQGIDFLSALFTATSASCVTGLIVADTWTQWSLFGQLVILTMIQIGGLGFVTIGVFLAIQMRSHIGLKGRTLLQESTSAMQIGGILKLTGLIIRGTALFEGIGALILALRFIPEYGFLRGCYYGIFHAVSAFCNAGFDLMGHMAPYNSLCGYVGDPVVNLVIVSLILIGGIGFLVWEDILTNRHHFRRYRLQTKIVLIATAVLTFGGMLAFYLIEKDQTMAGMSAGQAFWASLFCAVTPRTAGFNSVDTASLKDASKVLTMVFMLIGGSPGSTAGGVKTTSIVVILLYVSSCIQRTYGVNLFGRRLEEDAIKKASSIVAINMTLAVTAAIVIMAIQDLPMSDILFETFSAIGTAGMSTGVTRELLPFSRCLVIFLMYCGRIGSMSFALSFTQQKQIIKLQNPVEEINIG